MMGKSVCGEEDLSNYFPIEEPQTSLPPLPRDQPQKSLPPLPQQIRTSPRLSQKATFKGFRFEDNKAKYGWEDGENGMAQINIDSFLPPSMTLCMRGRILYNRHGDINYWFNVIIKRKKPAIYTPIDFGLYQRSKGEWILEGGDGKFFNFITMNKEQQEKAKKANSWPSRNTLRKWTHACVVGDFTKDKTSLFLNGKKINQTEFKFSKGLLTENYFSEELRLSREIVPGFSVEFGRHAYDSAPIIGELVDINAWDRALDEREMEAITSCRSFELRVGNLINMTSAFNVTGPLCQPIEVDTKELGCVDTNKDILLSVHANILSTAAKQCDRLLKRSLGPFLRTADKYSSLYKRLERLPKTEGFKDLCWFGGRVLVWLPYKKVSGKTTWNHITDGSEAVWDTTIYPKSNMKLSPKIEKDDVCLRWYSGPLSTYKGHGAPTDCDEDFDFDWAPCLTCSVPHTLGRLSKNLGDRLDILFDMSLAPLEVLV